MSDEDGEIGVDMLPMPKLTERDDPASQEIVALINTFTDHDTKSLENDAGWKDFKAALWDSLTNCLDDESSNCNDSVAASDVTSSAPASSHINTLTSQVYEAPEHVNSSMELTSGNSDSDIASDFADFSARQFYLPDLPRILNRNELELLDDEDPATTRIQFRGKEYVLSNGPRENVYPFVDNVLFDGFDSSGLVSRGHGEDAPPDMTEEMESGEGIFKVWDLGFIPDEDDEITTQLKVLSESSTGLSTQNQSANTIEERLYVSMVKADGDSSVGVSPSSDDLSTTLNEGNLDELIQGITNLSLSHGAHA